jgi:hypothetical protein
MAADSSGAVHEVRVLPEKLFLRIAGQLGEGPVGEDDRVAGKPGVGDDHRHPGHPDRLDEHAALLPNASMCRSDKVRAAVSAKLSWNSFIITPASCGSRRKCQRGPLRWRTLGCSLARSTRSEDDAPGCLS